MPHPPRVTHNLEQPGQKVGALETSSVSDYRALNLCVERTYSKKKQLAMQKRHNSWSPAGGNFVMNVSAYSRESNMILLCSMTVLTRCGCETSESCRSNSRLS